MLNLKKEISEAQGMVIVDFFASWCGPCKMMAPVLENVKKKYEESLKIIKIDIDEEPELAGEYEVMSVPTLLFFVNGVLSARESGFMPEEKLCEIIESKKATTAKA